MKTFTPEITDEYLNTALEASNIAVKIANEYTPSHGTYNQKAAPSDILTQADTNAQKEIINHIKTAYPDHTFLAEETATENETTPQDTPTWIIDPIDGTTNFQRNVSPSCTMIALEKDTTLHTGVIHMHNTNTVYYAVKNKGAYKNTTPITTSPVETLDKSLFAYEPTNRSVDREDTPQFNLFPYLLTETLGARKNKCAGYNLTRIAQGKYDAWIEHNAHVWDMAPGIIILKEAGGTVSTFNNNTQWDALKTHPRKFVATNGHNHQDVLTIANRMQETP